MSDHERKTDITSADWDYLTRLLYQLVEGDSGKPTDYMASHFRGCAQEFIAAYEQRRPVTKPEAEADD